MITLFVVCIIILVACETGKKNKTIENEVIQDNIRVKIISEKSVYKSNEKINLTVEYEYIGEEAGLVIYYDKPAIVCGLKRDDGKFHLAGISSGLLRSEYLVKNEVYSFTYRPYGVYRGDQLTSKQEKALFSEPSSFSLPKGSYTLDAMINFGTSERETYDGTVTIDFTVK